LKVVYILSIAFGGIQNLQIGVSKLKNLKKDIENQYLQAIVNSVGIISHISKTINEFDSRTFFLYKETKWQHHLNTEIEIILPKISFLSTQFEIPIKWEIKNKYKSDIFFDFWNSSVFFNAFSNAQSKNPTSTNNMFTLADEILAIINFIRKEHFFENS
jgi:hypothetical protein